MKRKNFPVLFMLLFMAASTSCTEKKATTNSQGEITPEKVTPYVENVAPTIASNIEPVYVFDIDSFTYFDEFPETISGIKEKYNDVSFQEKMQETSDTGHLRSLGDYIFSLTTENITFTFYGDTMEDAELRHVEIFSPSYQCPSIQIIGMSSTRVKDLIKATTKFTDEKNLLRITSKDWNTIVINIKNDIVVNYSINKAL